MFKVKCFYLILLALLTMIPVKSSAIAGNNQKVAAISNNLKLAVVDMGKINNVTLVSQNARKEISNEEKKIHEKLMKRKNDVESGFKSLESQRALLSSTELEKKAQKLESEYQKLQIDGSFYAEVFAVSKNYIFNTISGNINEATKAVVNSKKDKYYLVLPKESVIYLDSNEIVDITDDVIDKMNSMFKTINFEQIYEKAKKDVSRKPN